MTLISVIICITLERFLNSLHTIRNFRWLESLVDQFAATTNKQSHFKNLIFILIIVLIVPFVVLLIDVQLKYIFTPLEFLFATIVLFFSIGPETFYDRLKSFCDAFQNKDEASAIWFTEKILRRPTNENEKKQLPLTLLKNLFPIANDRIFAPIFWFALLGPFGAILYRCVSRVEYIYRIKSDASSNSNSTVAFLLNLLNWVPIRLSAFGFMLMGNFSESFRSCKKSKSATFFGFQSQNNENLLVCIATSALNIEINNAVIDHNNLTNALSLIRRNIELWLGFIALLTITGSL